eukprot:TRINITY_DN20343_c0_g1_i1.p1 TRINITY_DN20343_c0_g1~~TRINITY_DN20343_c0_g1_i1.p1  ORF type:complete len:152 (-),score=16.56 TRINITY_DN20343_c0_g1_i1:13-468(-)
MVNYMIVIDETINSRAAFFTALDVISRKDSVFLINLAERKKLLFSTIRRSHDELQYYQDSQQKAKTLLSRFKLILEERGVHRVEEIFAYGGTHSGQVISKHAALREINYIFVGKCAKKKSIFGGFPTSDYLIQHAGCNVVVIEDDLNSSAY